MKREPEIVVLSDLHLGTVGCQADALLYYLKNVEPKTLILNGDVLDLWNFKRNHFYKKHVEIIRRILKLSVSGTKVFYLSGNHDDRLRHFGEWSLGGIEFRDKLVFSLNGETYWAFHGDVFDVSIHQARWLARQGGRGYDLLIRINRAINSARAMLGLQKISFAKRIKQHVKHAVRFIQDFEETAIEMAALKGYDYVLCGHIHTPQMREAVASNGKTVHYLNSGDWVESCTALEYVHGKWSIYSYFEDAVEAVSPRLKVAARKKEVMSFEF